MKWKALHSELPATEIIQAEGYKGWCFEEGLQQVKLDFRISKVSQQKTV